MRGSGYFRAKIVSVRTAFCGDLASREEKPCFCGVRTYVIFLTPAPMPNKFKRLHFILTNPGTVCSHLFRQRRLHFLWADDASVELRLTAVASLKLTFLFVNKWVFSFSVELPER